MRRTMDSFYISCPSRRSVGASCMDGFALDAGDSLAASQSQLALHLVKRLQQTVATTKLPPTQLAGGSDRIGSGRRRVSLGRSINLRSLSFCVCAMQLIKTLFFYYGMRTSENCNVVRAQAQLNFILFYFSTNGI